MKKHMQFILGVITGAILFGCISVIAQQVYEINENPFKILVDGQKQNIQGYNIDGYTYFKLRDIGTHVGFTTDFKEDTILINTTNSVSPYGITGCTFPILFVKKLTLLHLIYSQITQISILLHTTV